VTKLPSREIAKDLIEQIAEQTWYYEEEIC